MRLEQLQFVIAICKHRSLSRAADALYINQPTLSRALTALEKELGVQLFSRSHQGMALTAVGIKMLPHFERMLAELERLQALAAAEKAGDISGTLTISAGSILCNNILLDITAIYNQSYPLIDIDVIEEYTPDTIRRVHKDQADIGFVSVTDYVKDGLMPLLDQYNLKYTFLIETPMVAVLPSTSPLAAQSVVTAEQLEPYPLFLHKKVRPILPPDVDRNTYHYCPDRESRNKMILKQQGYSIISQLEMLDDFYVRQGLLILRPVIDSNIPDNSLSLGMIYGKDRVLKFYEEDFITIVRQHFRSLTQEPLT